MPHEEVTIGDARLILGDCREVLPTLPKVDAVATDPPYGIVNQFGSMGGNGTRTLQFEWDKPEAIRGGIRGGIACCKPSAAVFVFTGFDTCELARDELRDAGFVVKPAAWVKKCPPPAGKGNWWPSGFELAMYGYRRSPWFGDTDPKRSNVFVSDSYRYGQPGKVDHPTQKPLGLMVRIVRSIVPPGGVVLDQFMGSGSTGVAAANLGRKFIGIERERRYFDIACERIARAKAQGTLELPDQAPKAEQAGLFDVAEKIIQPGAL